MIFTSGFLAAFAAGVASLAGSRALLHWGIRKGLAAPRVPNHSSPAALGLKAEEVHIATANARQLHAWLIRAP